jgi:hypothetical protein
MTPKQCESIIATSVLMEVQRRSMFYSVAGDETASAIAILVLALELATPDLSPERRASLFNHGENE